MNKPLSAVDLLNQIGAELNALKEDRIYAIYEKLLGHDETEPTTLELLKLASEAHAYDCLLDGLRNRYKHEELQSWGHDNEVV